MTTNNFFKFFLLAAFSLATAFVFTACGDDDPGSPPTENGNGNGNGGNGNGSTNPGIGEPTATTDPGVVIGETRWATRNVDAPGTFADYPHSFGMFYQWNRNIGWSSTDPMVNSNGGTAWDSTTPAGTAWYAENCPCPPGWRVPTEKELRELVTIDREWITGYNSTDVNGQLWGTAPNQVFVPFAGGLGSDNGALAYVGNCGGLWSSSTVDQYSAFYLGFCHISLSVPQPSIRQSGHNVRCVAY